MDKIQFWRRQKCVVEQELQGSGKQFDFADAARGSVR